MKSNSPPKIICKSPLRKLQTNVNTQKFTLVAPLMTATAAVVCASDNWKETLRKEVPLLGHRNWIVVADSAYPLQTAPGIETICADADQLTVVKKVLAQLVKAKHVQPAIYTDAELKFVAEKNAPRHRRLS